MLVVLKATPYDVGIKQICVADDMVGTLPLAVVWIHWLPVHHLLLELGVGHCLNDSQDGVTVFSRYRLRKQPILDLHGC